MIRQLGLCSAFARAGLKASFLVAIIIIVFSQIHEQ
jgi:hypothetical protein